MNVAQSNRNFPMRDVVVGVHYDNINPEYLSSRDFPESEGMLFVRGEIDDRNKQYIDQGKEVYNLSTLTKPQITEGITAIPTTSDDPRELSGHGLNAQLRELIEKLIQGGVKRSVEIVGFVWHYCDQIVYERLEGEELITPKVNYDCTDALVFYHIVESRGQDRKKPKFGPKGLLIPVPSPEVYERYKQHLHNQS